MLDVVVIGGIFREVLDGDSKPRMRFGGSGLTSALVASKVGARTALMGYVGEEDAPIVLPLLEAAGVDRETVLICEGSSGTFVFPEENEASTRPWPMYRPAEALPTDIPILPEASAYVLFGIPDFDPIAAGWVTNLPRDCVLLWDRQGWISRARDCLGASRLLAQKKIYLANLGEALEEFTASDRSKLFRKLPPSGFNAAVIKDGPRGCTVIDFTHEEKSTIDIDGIQINSTSSVGSGDAFAGALAAGLAEDHSLERAALQANAVAAAFLEAKGGSPLGGPCLPGT